MQKYGIAEEILPGIRRILAPNPKDYTGDGTNTYVLGGASVWIIDPSPDIDAHIDAVIKAVSDRTVVGICVTHSHMDHSKAAPKLKALTSAKVYGNTPLAGHIIEQTQEDVDRDFSPDVELAHGDIIGSGRLQMKVLHTPGHFPNHLCYRLIEPNIIFSGDHVMGWSTTSVVPPLGKLEDYLNSLDILEQENSNLMLPGHGSLIGNPSERLREIKAHRMMRHRQILSCLAQGITGPEKIATEIYIGLTPRLREAAVGCVEAHLELIREGALKKKRLLQNSG